jgi:hypothetical protein
MRIFLLDIRIHIMFLLITFAQLLWILSTIRILGNRPFVPILVFCDFFLSLLRPIFK